MPPPKQGNPAKPRNQRREARRPRPQPKTNPADRSLEPKPGVSRG